LVVFNVERIKLAPASNRITSYNLVPTGKCFSALWEYLIACPPARLFEQALCPHTKEFDEAAGRHPAW
jgi:hypothetical protein